MTSITSLPHPHQQTYASSIDPGNVAELTFGAGWHTDANAALTRVIYAASDAIVARIRVQYLATIARFKVADVVRTRVFVVTIGVIDSGKPTTAIAAIAATPADPAPVPAGDRFAELADYVDDLLDRAQAFEDRVTDLTTELENKLDDLTGELETERTSSAELADKVEELVDELKAERWARSELADRIEELERAHADASRLSATAPRLDIGTSPTPRRCPTRAFLRLHGGPTKFFCKGVTQLGGAGVQLGEDGGNPVVEVSTETLDLGQSETGEACFQMFLRDHRQAAVSLAWRLTGGDEAAAEDVAQEAFVRAWRALPRFQGDAALSTWFYRILVRQAHNHRRWHGVRERWHSLWGAEQRPPETETRPDAGLRERIGAALDDLSRGQREAFVLVHLQGMSVTQAAAVLGKAEGTVKSHVHRALKALRKDLADIYEEHRA